MNDSGYKIPNDDNVSPEDIQPGASLEEANLSEAELVGTDLSGAMLSNADLSEADLVEADLSEADLFAADLSGAVCDHTYFTGADLRAAAFGLPDKSDSMSTADPASLEGAVLKQADLRGTDLQHTRLYQADLSEARINAGTEFDTGKTIYERRDSLGEWSKELSDIQTPQQVGAWVHRRLERLNEANALSADARQHHIRKQEAERAHHRKVWQSSYRRKSPVQSIKTLLRSIKSMSLPRAVRSFGTWGALTFNRKLTNHGESLRRIVTWSVGVIAVAAVSYPLFGEIGTDNDSVIQFSWDQGVVGNIKVFLRSLYFSIITFSTIGYGDHYPADTPARFIVGIESIAGAILIALFIFVLGRRTAR